MPGKIIAPGNPGFDVPLENLSRHRPRKLPNMIAAADNPAGIRVSTGTPRGDMAEADDAG